MNVFEAQNYIFFHNLLFIPVKNTRFLPSADAATFAGGQYLDIGFTQVRLHSAQFKQTWLCSRWHELCASRRKNCSGAICNFAGAEWSRPSSFSASLRKRQADNQTWRSTGSPELSIERAVDMCIERAIASGRVFEFTSNGVKGFGVRCAARSQRNYS